MTTRSAAVPADRRVGPFGWEGPFSLLVTRLVGTVLSALDNTMVNVALAEIGLVFSIDLTMVQLVALSARPLQAQFGTIFTLAAGPAVGPGS